MKRADLPLDKQEELRMKDDPMLLDKAAEYLRAQGG